MANLHTPIPKLKLNDGNSMPMLAFGTGTSWYKAGDESKIDKDLIETIKIAIKLGYHHLDGAEVYQTEPELGIAIKESGVKREDLYVVTKVHKNIADIPGALKASLSKLQLSYVDLYLIHAPFDKTPAELQRAWAEMEKVKHAGLARSIGVSNYLIPHLDALLEKASTPPAVNQIEFHPYLQHTTPSPGLLEYHKRHGIATAAYGPLTAVAKAAPGPVDDYAAALATKYAVSAGEVMLRWCVDQDVVPVTTSGKEQRLSDYLRAMTFKLTPKEVQEIGRLGGEKHFRGFWKKKFEEGDQS